jgi:predicted lipid-binding transport protein (Tim44 family)
MVRIRLIGDLSSHSTSGVDPTIVGGMTGLAVTLLIIGIVLLLLGVFVEAVKFLLWIGLVLLILAVIAWLMRFIRRQT